ncbi:MULTISPECIES: hypothetical protein [unclassified Saccharothrix]|uniref:hypothetical protein n=1 Tax=unclassified Saccharothrix TaxID=2593673 RepID=UPI00307DB29B
MARRGGGAGIFKPILNWLRKGKRTGGGPGGPPRPNRAPGTPGPHTTPRYNRQKPMLDKYKHETDPNHPANPFPGRSVRRLNDAEREAHRVFIDGQGNLRRARDGSLYDTQQGTSAWGGGRAIFVMDGRGNIYASNHHAPGQFHHSSLAGGHPVAAAGELSVSNGRVQYATAASGHYQPGPEHMANLAQEFGRNGIRPPIWDFRGPHPGGRPLFA